MYQAEIQGKLPAEVARSEDLLTSNVFSFFKYADRERYLRDLLRLLELDLTNEELSDAEFEFWPSYEDNTEPDVVLVIGDYYILFEAKYFSGFGPATAKRRGQVERELEQGLHQARALGKTFVPVAVTSHASRPSAELATTSTGSAHRFRWINWQSVAFILLNALEQMGGEAPSFDFAQDLYYLLDRKKLRGYLSFSRLEDSYTAPPRDQVFFAPESSTYRGDFIGFDTALSIVDVLDPVGSVVFFRRSYFTPALAVSTELDERPIFWMEET